VGAGVGSAAVAFVAVLLAASFDPRVRETRRYAALGLAPIGRIPRMPRPDRQSLWGALRRYSGSPDPREHDTVRYALTALRRKRRQEGCMTLLVTAARRGEGLSTTVAAIASAEASSGARVLVIDLEQGGHGISAGLSSVRSAHSLDELTASAELMRREIAPPGGDVGFFLVAPASVRPASGNPKSARATELHIVQRERITLEPLKARFDLILLEVPPVLNDTTALKLAPLADETLLVVRMNKARLSSLAQAVSVLRSSFIEPAGTIENHG
jgi:Mrp family chromosome partitioning ATPase